MLDKYGKLMNCENEKLRNYKYNGTDILSILILQYNKKNSSKPLHIQNLL